MSGEKDGGLAGRVAAADENDQGALTEPCLIGTSGIVDSRALVPRATLNPEAAVLRAGGNQKAFGGNGLTPFQIQDRVTLVEYQTIHSRGDRQLSAEFICLEHCAAGQFTSG